MPGVSIGRISQGDVLVLGAVGQTPPDVPHGLDEAKGVGHWQAMLLAPNGSTVTLDEVNSASPYLPATRSTPPLSLEQLDAIVASPVWNQFK
jgi:hypothetical protein